MLCDLCGELAETVWDAEQGDLCAGCAQLVARTRREDQDGETPDSTWYAEQNVEWEEEKRWLNQSVEGGNNDGGLAS